MLADFTWVGADGLCVIVTQGMVRLTIGLEYTRAVALFSYLDTWISLVGKPYWFCICTGCDRALFGFTALPPFSAFCIDLPVRQSGACTVFVLYNQILRGLEALQSTVSTLLFKAV